MPVSNESRLHPSKQSQHVDKRVSSVLHGGRNRLHDLMESQSLLASYYVTSDNPINTSYEEEDGFLYKRGAKLPFSQQTMSRIRSEASPPSDQIHRRITKNEPLEIDTVSGPRNKRRASSHKRGKRALSIGNGLTAEPHFDVLPADYYRLLDTSAPAPDRMRQLIIWCFKKKMSEYEKERLLASEPYSPHKLATQNITKVIRQEMLNDLMRKKISVSWLDKAHQKPIDRQTIVIPNSVNLANKKNLENCFIRLERIRQQQQKWNQIITKTISTLSTIPAPPYKVSSEKTGSASTAKPASSGSDAESFPPARQGRIPKNNNTTQNSRSVPAPDGTSEEVLRPRKTIRIENLPPAAVTDELDRACADILFRVSASATKTEEFEAMSLCISQSPEILDALTLQRGKSLLGLEVAKDWTKYVFPNSQDGANAKSVADCVWAYMKRAQLPAG